MGLFDKAKTAVKNYTDGLKQQEAKNNELMAATMEERIKMRPDGVMHYLVNNLGKILDVYENKVVFTLHNQLLLSLQLFFWVGQLHKEKKLSISKMLLLFSISHQPLLMDIYK